jgi:hypothetical protein
VTRGAAGSPRDSVGCGGVLAVEAGRGARTLHGGTTVWHDVVKTIRLSHLHTFCYELRGG